jgi:hypothetical protein
MKNQSFDDGVRYALQRLEEIFGSEVADTDIWRDYFETSDEEDE